MWMKLFVSFERTVKNQACIQAWLSNSKQLLLVFTRRHQISNFRTIDPPEILLS